jgi:large subunit ribosomal protein L17
MRHQMAHRKIGRTSAHRAALFRNQLASMIENERIVTTLVKAKELRPIVEKMVTLGKNDSVHSRRLAARSLPENDLLVRKLFENVSPRFAQRPGGYTRIIKLGPRRGDGAEMAILEFVDFEFKREEPEPTKGKKKAAAAPAAAEEPVAETEEAEEQPEAPRRKKQAKSKAEPEKKARGKKSPSKPKSAGKKKK